MKSLVPVEIITSKIYLIRDQKVMLDRDLADLYGVETKQLKRAVRRHVKRFPEDFMFQLTKEEYLFLRGQFGTLKRGAHSKYLPMAFTEQGIAMLSSVLNSSQAIEVNIAIMRAFVQLRKMIGLHNELSRKLSDLEKKLGDHDPGDEGIVLFQQCSENVAGCAAAFSQVMNPYRSVDQNRFHRSSHSSRPLRIFSRSRSRSIFPR